MPLLQPVLVGQTYELRMVSNMNDLAFPSRQRQTGFCGSPNTPYAPDDGEDGDVTLVEEAEVKVKEEDTEMGIPDTSSVATIVPTSRSGRRLVALNDAHDESKDGTPAKSLAGTKRKLGFCWEALTRREVIDQLALEQAAANASRSILRQSQSRLQEYSQARDRVWGLNPARQDGQRAPLMRMHPTAKVWTPIEEKFEFSFAFRASPKPNVSISIGPSLPLPSPAALAAPAPPSVNAQPRLVRHLPQGTHRFRALSAPPCFQPLSSQPVTLPSALQVPSLAQVAPRPLNAVSPRPPTDSRPLERAFRDWRSAVPIIDEEADDVADVDMKDEGDDDDMDGTPSGPVPASSGSKACGRVKALSALLRQLSLELETPVPFPYGIPDRPARLATTTSVTPAAGSGAGALRHLGGRLPWRLDEIVMQLTYQ
ncbi:hypothetical protein C8Q76DRAFT_858008 [Earliella scabrosa]|nr:hypothetical protein C8Q76DRAFT_858008 [Earliella scabrosa]